MNQDFISFDVGTNFDYKLFDVIEKFDKKHSINSFYGKLKDDGLPGGRANFVVPDFTFEQLQEYVAECKKRDITFNYLINPLGMDQNETDPVVGKQIREFIHNAYDIGIRAFTLNSPILIRYAKKNFKDIFITLGLYAYPGTVQHLEYWRNIGVDEITLDHAFNRNFELLRKVLTNYKDSDLHLRVIANNLCLRECPYRLTHGSFIGHSDNKAMSIDYSLINCEYHKITNPTALLTSEWIRPEDVHVYRELAQETGNKNFSIKLVDRTRTTEYISRVIEAYMTEHYEGNLLRILNWPEPRTMNKLSGNVDQYLDGVKDVGKEGGVKLDSAPAGAPPAGMPMGAGGPPMGMPPMGAGGPPAGMPPFGAGGPPAGMPPFGAGGPPAGMPPFGAGGPPAGMPPFGAGGPPAGMPPFGAGGPPMGPDGKPMIPPMGISGPPAGMPKIRHMEFMKPESLMYYGKTMALPNINIDNRKLDGFLDHFINNNNSCRGNLCAGSILTDGSEPANVCKKCSAWAQKAISYDPEEVENWKGVASSFLESLENGTIYREF